MNVPKRLIGQLVELHWKDPNAGRGMIKDLVKGRDALATWREFGVIHDITDGVVIIVHSYAASPGDPIEKPDEVYRTAVPEDLIDKIITYQVAVQQ